MKTGVVSDFDYVGAPWTDTVVAKINLEAEILANASSYPPMKMRIHVGNGGLSLRRISAMVELSRKVAWDGITPEDVWFSSKLQARSPARKSEPLALPSPTDAVEHSSAPRILQVGGPSVSLDELGPIIINADGTLRSEKHFDIP
jgi:hypothetical protein